MKNTFFFLLAFLAGALGAFYVLTFYQPSENQLIKEFYNVENAVHVSPHGLRKLMDKGDTSFILVDLRSQEEYEEEHITSAINIPAYKDRDHSDYGAVQRIVSQFAQLPKDKTIIVYCYSTPCMTGRKVGKMLADRNIYVKHLGIGWNDWKYHWKMWNHEHEWEKTNSSMYITTGKEPGSLAINLSSKSCPINGELGC